MNPKLNPQPRYTDIAIDLLRLRCEIALSRMGVAQPSAALFRHPTIDISHERTSR